jgi:hypothetical protein
VQASKTIQDHPELQSNLDRFSLLIRIVEQYLSAGQLDKAIQIVTSLDSADAGDDLLNRLVARQLLAIQKDNATEKLRTAFHSGNQG